MRFEFATATRILFGLGICTEVPELAVPFGRRALVVVDSSERAEFLLEGLLGKGIINTVFEINKEPDVKSILMAMHRYKDSACDLVIGFGGGSVIDTGKAVAALSANPGDPLDYLEVIGLGRELKKPSAPYIAIPTTAGTGSEVTRNAVIAVPEKRVKVSLRSPFLLPRIAVVDPELTYSLPQEITARTGLDALTQVIEPFVCNDPTPLTDIICRDGIARAGQSLLNAYQDGRNTTARENMSLVSLYGGMALANARLGAVHGLAGPLGGMYPAPHGSICARLLPLVMEANLQALRSRQQDSPALTRYREVGQLLTSNTLSTADGGVDHVREICERMAIRPLGIYGLKSDDFSTVIAQAQKSSSMRGNPILLTDQELRGILEKAM
jgi:alcohol dehydrogenase class IV